jgi:hypothetical protein
VGVAELENSNGGRKICSEFTTQIEKAFLQVTTQFNTTDIYLSKKKKKKKTEVTLIHFEHGFEIIFREKWNQLLCYFK